MKRLLIAFALLAPGCGGADPATMEQLASPMMDERAEAEDGAGGSARAAADLAVRRTAPDGTAGAAVGGGTSVDAERRVREDDPGVLPPSRGAGVLFERRVRERDPRALPTDSGAGAEGERRVREDDPGFAGWDDPGVGWIDGYAAELARRMLEDGRGVAFSGRFQGSMRPFRLYEPEGFAALSDVAWLVAVSERPDLIEDAAARILGESVSLDWESVAALKAQVVEEGLVDASDLGSHE